MKRSSLCLILVLALATGCSGAGEDSRYAVSDGPDEAALTLPGNESVLQMVYDSDYEVPTGFYVDPRANTTRSYTIHHVLDRSGSFELCSDDLVDAQALEHADNAARAVSGYFVTSIENERYFEFVRELDYTEDAGNIADLTSPGYARIFKCGYADRQGVDRNLLDGYTGRLKAAPLDADALQAFVEYLWQFTFFDVSKKKVIDSRRSTASGQLQHILLLALVINQGADRCDRVELSQWRFSADPGSGELGREFETLRSFEATLAAGIPVLCQ